jgi:hypothetical protein
MGQDGLGLAYLNFNEIPLSTTAAAAGDFVVVMRAAGILQRMTVANSGFGAGSTGPTGPAGADSTVPGPTGPAGADGEDATPAGVLGITIDGGGSAITTGVKGFLRVPYACTITKATLLSYDEDGAPLAGDCVIDVWKNTYANWPPTVADTITASAKPTLSAAAKSEDATLTGWTKTIAAGEVLAFNVDSAATITRLTLILDVTKT